MGFPLEISTILIQPSHTPNAGFGGHSSRLTFLRPRPKTAETSLPECGCGKYELHKKLDEISAEFPMFIYICKNGAMISEP